MSHQTPTARMAIDCQWLRRSLDPTRRDPYAMCCTHIIREGADCVGPFLEDVETNCRLWDHAGPPAGRARRHASGRP